MRDDAGAVSWFLLGLAVCFQAAAVIVGKVAAIRMGQPSAFALLTSPWYLGGLGCLALQALCWQTVLRRIRFFVAYLTLTGLNYIAILAASWLLFQERITAWHAGGAALIVFGIFITIREEAR